MSLKLKCHQNWNVTKKITPTEMSLQLKCHKNWNVMRNWCGSKTEMLHNLKMPSKWYLNQNKIQEIGTDHLGLVSLFGGGTPYKSYE